MAMLNKSSRVWAPWFGMGCKAQTTVIAQLWRGFATLQAAQNRDDRAAKDLLSVALKGKPFHSFAYGAACAAVVVDTLTGEHKVLRANLLHDVGNSLNPAIDSGQIEGAFIQGMGWPTARVKLLVASFMQPKAGY
jgi:CO/xanthine dehydrogenase Mo-binding subunit